jgi:hypothetical protein
VVQVRADAAEFYGDVVAADIERFVVQRLVQVTDEVYDEF